MLIGRHPLTHLAQVLHACQLKGSSLQHVQLPGVKPVGLGVAPAPTHRRHTCNTKVESEKPERERELTPQCS